MRPNHARGVLIGVRVLLQFARLYPLNQLDLPVEKKHVDFGPLMAPGAKIENPSRDYTPPSMSCCA